MKDSDADKDQRYRYAGGDVHGKAWGFISEGLERGGLRDGLRAATNIKLAASTMFGPSRKVWWINRESKKAAPTPSEERLIDFFHYVGEANLDKVEEALKSGTREETKKLTHGRAGGVTPLMWAMMWPDRNYADKFMHFQKDKAEDKENRIKIINALLPHSDLSARDTDGWTALHWSLAIGYEERALCLLNYAQEPVSATLPPEFFSPVWETYVEGDKAVPVPLCMLSRRWKLDIAEAGRVTTTYRIRPKSQKLGQMTVDVTRTDIGKDGKDSLLTQEHTAVADHTDFTLRPTQQAAVRGCTLNTGRAKGRPDLLPAVRSWHHQYSQIKDDLVDFYIQASCKYFVTDGDWNQPERGPTPLHWAYLHGWLNVAKKIEEMGRDAKEVRDTLDLQAVEYLIHSEQGEKWLMGEEVEDNVNRQLCQAWRLMKERITNMDPSTPSVVHCMLCRYSAEAISSFKDKLQDGNGFEKAFELVDERLKNAVRRSLWADALMRDGGFCVALNEARCLDKRSDPEGNTVQLLFLQCACAVGNIYIVRQFLATERRQSVRDFLVHHRIKKPGEPEETTMYEPGDSALSLAAGQGHLDVVMQLLKFSKGLERGYDRSLTKAFVMALRNAHEKVIVFLRDFFTENGLTPPLPRSLVGCTRESISVAVTNQVFAPDAVGRLLKRTFDNVKAEDLPKAELPGADSAMVVLRTQDEDDEAAWDQQRKTARELWEKGKDKIFSVLLVNWEPGPEDHWAQNAVQLHTKSDIISSHKKAQKKKKSDSIFDIHSIIKGGACSLLLLGDIEQPALDWMRDAALTRLYFAGTDWTKIKASVFSACREGYHVHVIRDLIMLPDGHPETERELGNIVFIGGFTCWAREPENDSKEESKKKWRGNGGIPDDGGFFGEAVLLRKNTAGDRTADDFSLCLYKASVTMSIFSSRGVALDHWLGQSVEAAPLGRGLDILQQKGLLGDIRFGDRAGELFIVLAGLSHEHRKICWTSGFNIAGSYFNPGYREKWMLSPLHLLILRKYHGDTAVKTLLLDAIKFVNARSQTLPKYTNVICYGGPADAEGKEGEIESCNAGLADVRFPGLGIKRAIPRLCLRPTGVIPVMQAKDWHIFREGWWWKLATVDVTHKDLIEMEEFIYNHPPAGRTKDHKPIKKTTLKSILQLMPLDAPVRALTLAALLGDTLTVEAMVGAGQGLTLSRIERSKDVDGTEFEADCVRDIWLCTPTRSWHYNEPKTAMPYRPVLHTVLAAIRDVHNSISGYLPDSESNFREYLMVGGTKTGPDDLHPIPGVPFGGSRYLMDGALKSIICDVDLGVMPLLATAAFVGVDAAAQDIEVRKRLENLEKVADILLRSDDGWSRRLTEGGQATGVLYLIEACHGYMPTKIIPHLDRPGFLFEHEQEYDPYVLDHLREHADCPVFAHGNVIGGQTVSESGLGLLLQSGSEKLLDTVLELKLLERCSGLHNSEELNRMLLGKSMPAVLLLHRHLWAATHGGHQTMVLDHGLTLTHWACLRDCDALLERLISGTFGSLPTYLVRETSTADTANLYGDVVEISEKLKCRVSALGYSPLHYAVYAGSVACLSQLIMYVSGSDIFTVDDLVKFINYQAQPSAEGVRGMGFSELLAPDVAWIKKEMTRAPKEDDDPLESCQKILKRCHRTSTAGDTALHIAAQFNFVVCTSILIEHGADATLCNSLEGLDPHDVTLMLQHHHTMQCLGSTRNGDFLSCCDQHGYCYARSLDPGADDITTSIESMLSVYAANADTDEAIRIKLGAHAWKQFFGSFTTSGGVLYLIFLVCLFCVAFLLVSGGEHYGARGIDDAIKLAVPPFGTAPTVYVPTFDVIADLADLRSFLTMSFWNVFFDGNDEHKKLYGTYIILGALRIATLRTSEGDCGTKTVRRGECWGDWSMDNNNDTKHTIASWQDWSEPRWGAREVPYLQPYTMEYFPSDRGMVVDVPVWGTGANVTRDLIKASIDGDLIDMATRFVQITMALYCPNAARLFSVQLSWEQTKEGSIFGAVDVVPFRYTAYAMWQDWVRLAFEIAVVGFSLSFLIEEMQDFNFSLFRALHYAEEKEDPPEETVTWLKAHSQAGSKAEANSENEPISSEDETGSDEKTCRRTKIVHGVVIKIISQIRSEIQERGNFIMIDESEEEEAEEYFKRYEDELTTLTDYAMSRPIVEKLVDDLIKTDSELHQGVGKIVKGTIRREQQRLGKVSESALLHGSVRNIYSARMEREETGESEANEPTSPLRLTQAFASGLLGYEDDEGHMDEEKLSSIKQNLWKLRTVKKGHLRRELRTRLARVYSTIDATLLRCTGDVLNNLETGSTDPDTEYAGTGGVIRCCTVFCRTVGFYIYDEEQGAMNLFDLLVVALIMWVIGLRVDQFILWSDKPSLYDMIDTNDTVMGQTYIDLLPVASLQEQQRYTLAAALVLGGMKVIKILAKLPRIGPTVRAITGTMTNRDTLTFLVLEFYLVVLMFFCVHTAFSPGNQDAFSSADVTFYSIFSLMLGDWDFDTFRTSHPIFGPILFMLMVVIGFLVMLNILIAVVSEVYADLTVKMRSEWTETASKDYLSGADRLSVVDPEEAVYATPAWCAVFLGDRIVTANAVGRLRCEFNEEERSDLIQDKIEWEWRFLPVGPKAIKRQRTQQALRSLGTEETVERILNESAASTEMKIGSSTHALEARIEATSRSTLEAVARVMAPDRGLTKEIL
eukprot:Hpha_TRINITY_DN15400_c0_g1::TRINITY_DN15400_c0_g1_i1::g.177092::m.177092